MSFRQVLLKNQEFVPEVTEGWSSIDVVYEKWLESQKEQKSEKQSLVEKQTNKRDVVIDTLAAFHNDLKTYWEQFGFLSNSTLAGIANTVAKNVEIQEVDDDFSGNDKQADEDDNN